MKHLTLKVLGSVVVAGVAAASLSRMTAQAPVSESSERSGELHIIKNCASYNGQAGDHCTITSSNIPKIPPGTTVFYDQAIGIPNPDAPNPPGMLDSNVVLFVRKGDWAVGHCTLDAPELSIGLCTFSDGYGQLSGFCARALVTPASGADFHWDGPYSFGESER